MAAKKRSFFTTLIFIINWIFALGLLFSYLAYYIKPTLFAPISLFALAYPALLLANGLFIIFWALKVNKKVWLSVLAILLGFLHLSRSYQLNSFKKVHNPNESLRVMSFNVRLFNNLRWIEVDDVPEQVEQLILTEKPDLLFFQEYNENQHFNAQKLGFKYSSEYKVKGSKKRRMIFSKLPVVASNLVRMPVEGKRTLDFLKMDVEWNGKVIRLLNIHLASVGLSKNDYELLENMEHEERNKVEQGVKKMMQSSMEAAIYRQIQSEIVAQEIKESPYPVILCGDFNDAPQSYTYHQIDKLLEDSFIESGQGWPRTYINGPLPWRIDYIFHSEHFKGSNFKVLNNIELSDHYPQVVDLEWED